MRIENFPEPASDPEAEGLPEIADDERTAYDDVDADGTEVAALPGDSPLAVDRYGVTPEEARLGEPLDYKLARERFDGRGHALDEGVGVDDSDGVDMGSDELDLPDYDTGLADDGPIEPDRSAVSMYDRDDFDDGGRPVGRLVEPDEGAREDRDADAVAYDAGSAGGGPSAEELAIHEVYEP